MCNGDSRRLACFITYDVGYIILHYTYNTAGRHVLQFACSHVYYIHVSAAGHYVCYKYVQLSTTCIKMCNYVQ